MWRSRKEQRRSRSREEHWSIFVAQRQLVCVGRRGPARSPMTLWSFTVALSCAYLFPSIFPIFLFLFGVSMYDLVHIFLVQEEIVVDIFDVICSNINLQGVRKTKSIPLHFSNQTSRCYHSIPHIVLNQTRERNQPILMEWNHDIPFHFVPQPNTPQVIIVIQHSAYDEQSWTVKCTHKQIRDA